MSDGDFDYTDSLDPVELFKKDNELVKSNLSAAQCSALAASDALSEYHLDSTVGVMALFRLGIRNYSRARDGYATEQYVSVLGKRIIVRDQHPEESEMG